MTPFTRHFAVALAVAIIATAHFLHLTDQLDALAPHSWRGVYIRRASVARGGQQSRRTELTQMRMEAKVLSSSMLAEFDSRGFVVVRGAVPRAAVALLRAAVSEEFPGLETVEGSLDSSSHLWQLGHVWLLSMNTWMDVSAFADFALHKDSPVGALAAQILESQHIRLGGEVLQGIWPHEHSYVWHRDVAALGSVPLNVSELAHRLRPGQRRSRAYPCVRVFLPLADEDIVANDTGGSLALLPLDSSVDCTRGACDRMAVTPDLALGDLVLYSPLVWHRTQPMRRGTRVSYVATFFDPDAWPRTVSELGPKPCVVSIAGTPWRDMCPIDGTFPLAFDALGLWAHCWDGLRSEFHYNFEFPSAYTAGVSREPSACFPLVFPRPALREVKARRLGQVQNLVGAYALRDRIRKHSRRLLAAFR